MAGDLPGHCHGGANKLVPRDAVKSARPELPPLRDWLKQVVFLLLQTLV